VRAIHKAVLPRDGGSLRQVLDAVEQASPRFGLNIVKRRAYFVSEFSSLSALSALSARSALSALSARSALSALFALGALAALSALSAGSALFGVFAIVAFLPSWLSARCSHGPPTECS
jgi:hypothetical protein